MLFLIFALPLFFIGSIASSAPLEKVESDTRCPVCGMYVAKYNIWITQIRYDESTVYSFDGVKDMMAYYHNPVLYYGRNQSEINEIWVKDYYSLKWLEAQDAFFVIGSDMHGPMGHELIPFSSEAAAKSFLADHHGQQILTFDELTVEIIDRLRVGNSMKIMKR